ncbi:MAG TPA: hypothetical protein VFC73_04320 [Syntrophomonadaceae bacterium]|nr:hypothetical protein [Syntrophomonadaceae bacterium]
MKKAFISNHLLEDYHLLAKYLEGSTIKRIVDCTETHIALLLENDIVISFLHFEDEIIFDIELPR